MSFLDPLIAATRPDSVWYPWCLFIAHLVGDFILQSDWMAVHKSKKTWNCLVHVSFYALLFIPLVSGPALAIIVGTHFAIDRFGLPRYLVWLKNHLAPGGEYYPWKDCDITGYQDKEIKVTDQNGSWLSTPPSRPFFITFPIYVVADNTLHLICNMLAVLYFPA